MTFSTADGAYKSAVRQVMNHGTRKPNRTGIDTISTFGVHYNIDLNWGFPLLTTKEINWSNIVIEMLWFLSGRTDIEILQRFGIKFWDAWADKDGKVPSAYGSFWRSFPVHGNEFEVDLGFNDQISWVIEELKRNPMSRRLVVSAWYPQNAQTSKLPPCHCLFVFNVQNEKYKKTLNLHLTQRSCDMALGIPYNIASYALLLHLVARFTGLEPGTFSHTLVDAHIYTANEDGSNAEYDHLPGLEEQLSREAKQAPSKLILSDSIKELADVEKLMDVQDKEEIMKHFVLNGYDPHPAIKFKVAV